MHAWVYMCVPHMDKCRIGQSLSAVSCVPVLGNACYCSSHTNREREIEREREGDREREGERERGLDKMTRRDGVEQFSSLWRNQSVSHDHWCVRVHSSWLN